MMTILLAAALSLLGGPSPSPCAPGLATPCQIDEGLATPPGDDTYQWTLERPGMMPVSFYPHHNIAHESALTFPLDRREAEGRWVKVCREHWPPRVVIVGGEHPRDFAMAMAVEGWAGDIAAERARAGRSVDRSLADGWPPRRGWPAPPAVSSFPATLVARGLSSDRYLTRRASQDVLLRMVRAGEPGAFGALVGGLRGRDVEVRVRCAAVLNEMRTGVSADGEGGVR